jgi:hypothetical protein
VVFLWNNGPDDVNLPGIDRYEVAGENQGCMARWKMALHATTPWIMSLDDDLCFARDDALETIIHTLKTMDDPARIIGPAGCNFHDNPNYSQRRDVYAGYASEPFCEPVDVPVRHHEAVDMIKGRSMALRRDQLDGLAFPDEREDDIFLNAALAHGRRKFHRVPLHLNSAFRQLPELGVGNWFMPEHLNSRDRATAEYFFPESPQPLQAEADGSWRPHSLGIICEQRDGQLLVQLANGSGVQLNSTASLIWALCDGHRTEAELLTILIEDFDAPKNELQHTLRSALNELLNIGALEPVGTDSE